MEKLKDRSTKLKSRKIKHMWAAAAATVAAATAARFSKRKSQSSRKPNKTTDMILLLTHLYLCGVRAESDNVL